VIAYAEIARIAFTSIRATKLRSFLTTLGMVIGVAAVITMVALGTGAQVAVQAQLDSMGTDLLSIFPGQNMWHGVSLSDPARLTLDDVDALRKEAPALKAVVPTLSGEFQVEYEGANHNADVVATTPDFGPVSRFTMDLGRFITEQDDLAHRRVAVLGWDVPGYLQKKPEELLGREITIRGIRFEVVGILTRKGEQPGPDPDETIYLPFRTGHQRFFGRQYSNRLRSLTVQLAHPDSMNAALLEIESVLRTQHRLRPGEDNDFRILDRSQFLTARSEANETLGYLLAGIAAISLLVGGIGIMNIMLVSVTERTREIGIRKALGATSRSVMMQFLAEALTLALLGGVIGIGVGIGSSALLSHLKGWQTFVSIKAIFVAVGFSAAVGVFFGVWPARKAARLDPIEALRYE
jgi:putative ABC transport system permease protein